MATIATQRVKREFREVLKSEEVSLAYFESLHAYCFHEALLADSTIATSGTVEATKDAQKENSL